MIGVEVRQPEMPDAAFRLQSRQLAHSIEIPWMLENPPMQLQKIDRLDAEPVETFGDAGPYDVGTHRPGNGAPLREGRGPDVLAAGGPPQELARYQFGAAVVVGHVESIEPGLRIFGHGVRGGASV